MSGALSIDQALAQALAAVGASKLAYQRAAPASGGTVVMNPGMAVLTLTGSTVLAAVTVKLPPAPPGGDLDKQFVRISSQAAITALSVQDASGNPVASLALSALGIGALFQFQSGAWVRIG